MSVPHLFADQKPAEPVLTVRLNQRTTDRVQVAVTGEIDMDTAERLDDAVAHALTMPGVRRVEVDLTEVTFMDSSGIHVLVRHHAGVHRAGFSLVVTYPQPNVLRVLQITGLSDGAMVKTCG